MTRRVVLCRPLTVAVGVDPGPSQGGVAVVATDAQGCPTVVHLEEWRKDKRKRPRARYRVWYLAHDGWVERDGGLAHPDRSVVALAQIANSIADTSGWQLAGAVENIQMFGPPRAGLLKLASSAGGHEALLRRVLGVDIVRPAERVWVRQVAAVPSRARKAQTRKLLTAAYEGRACVDGLPVVDWRCRFDGATPSEHAVDALGIALYAAGAQLVTPQERQHDKAAED